MTVTTRKCYYKQNAIHFIHFSLWIMFSYTVKGKELICYEHIIKRYFQSRKMFHYDNHSWENKKLRQLRWTTQYKIERYISKSKKRIYYTQNLALHIKYKTFHVLQHVLALPIAKSQREHKQVFEAVHTCTNHTGMFVKIPHLYALFCKDRQKKKKPERQEKKKILTPLHKLKKKKDTKES